MLEAFTLRLSYHNTETGEWTHTEHTKNTLPAHPIYSPSSTVFLTLEKGALRTAVQKESPILSFLPRAAAIFCSLRQLFLPNLHPSDFLTSTLSSFLALTSSQILPEAQHHEGQTQVCLQKLKS